MTSIRMTLAEWRAEGQRRFGDDQLKWRFKCPACGHVQAVEDFRAYKDKGATADSANFNCIGRYGGAKRGAFEDKGPGPCNYTSGGLFNISPMVVVTEDGKEHRGFDFADALPCESNAQVRDATPTNTTPEG